MDSDKSSGILCVIKGTFLMLITVLAGILIFAGIIKLASLSEGVVKPVNQFIKILSVFLGCFFSVRGKLGFLKGGSIGTLGMAVTYLFFSLLGGELSFGGAFLLDLLFGLIAGVISGIVSVNVKKD